MSRGLGFFREKIFRSATKQDALVSIRREAGRPNAAGQSAPHVLAPPQRPPRPSTVLLRPIAAPPAPLAPRPPAVPLAIHPLRRATGLRLPWHALHPASPGSHARRAPASLRAACRCSRARTALPGDDGGLGAWQVRPALRAALMPMPHRPRPAPLPQARSARSRSRARFRAVPTAGDALRASWTRTALSAHTMCVLQRGVSARATGALGARAAGRRARAAPAGRKNVLPAMRRPCVQERAACAPWLASYGAEKLRAPAQRVLTAPRCRPPRAQGTRFPLGKCLLQASNRKIFSGSRLPALAGGSFLTGGRAKKMLTFFMAPSPTYTL